MNEVLRQEKKFLISLDKFYKYAHYLNKLIQEDIHNNGEGYIIRSLYFDTLDDKDFTDKEDGIEIRRKIRLRNYGDESSFAFLEMKQKQGSMQKKRSLSMSKEDAQKLIQRDYGVLLKYSEPFALECYYLLNTLCYSPKAVVEYRRKAYISKENSTRITFDYNIRGTESCYDIFSKDLLQNTIFNNDLVVLEVKYNGFLLSYLKDILKECDASEISVSKYCLGRTLSKHYSF